MRATKLYKYISILICVIFYNYIAYPQAVQKNDSLQNVLSIHIEKNDTVNIFKTYYSISNKLYKNNRYYEANIYLNKAIKFANTIQKIKIYNRQGIIYWYKGEYDKAMNLYQIELKLCEKTNNKKWLAMSLNNIGFIYAEYNKHDKTLEYYKKALKIRKEINDKKGIGLSYNSIGRVYLKMDSLDKSLKYCNLSLKIFRSIKYFKGESNTLNNIGNIFLQKKQFQIAMKYYIQSLKLRKKINHSHLIAESYKNIAKTHIKNSDNKSAELIIAKGIIISKEIKSKKLLKNFYYQLFELNKKNSNFKKALSNYIKYFEIKDSLLSIESENVISELEIQYQTEKKEQKIEHLNIQNTLNAKVILNQKNNLILLISGSSILFISLLIVLFLFYQRNKAYKMLVKQNIEIVNLEKDRKQEKQTQKITNEQQIINDLLIIIEEDNYFLTTTCSIDELAKKINTNRQYLSKIINDKFQSNFNTFINTYRIKEARKLLLDSEYDKYTIDAIAKLSGFKNRTTFNAVFKKNTGVTPSFFKKEQKFV